jgi:beta-glucosidase
MLRHISILLLAISLCLETILLHSSALAQTLDDRIEALLAKMTIQEKILQLHQEGGMNTADNARLGIPGFLMADGPHGVREGLATSFPVGIGMAAMWDTAMARRIGVAMGEEFRGKGKHQALGPALDIDRDPRNGRSPETGGEDPYLCAQTTTAVVRGMQSTPIITTIKHYNVNHRENGRTSNDITISDRMLNEDAGLAFRTAIQMGGALSVMNAYNLINGEKCAENTNLLTTILRTRWGFPFYVVSDWASIWSSEKAIKAGCDICMGSNNYRDDLPGLVSNGTVPVSTIDRAVRRVLRTKFVAGMMDYQPSGDPGDVNSLAHQAVCREAGRKSLVLLKNEGSLLPLSTALPKGIALVGPNAATLVYDGSGSAYVTPFFTVSPRQGIEALVGSAMVKYARGCDVNSADTSGFAEAVALASAADVVVFCGGLDATQEGEGFDRVGGSTALPGMQQDLIRRLASANPNVIGVIFSGGVCTMSRCIDKLKGLIYAFYPGQEGGTAVAEVLFGTVNPAGRLPVTFPRDDSQLPPWNDDMTDDYGAGYRWFDKLGYVPQFAFGYGLSYTTFTYTNLTVTPGVAAPGQPITVTVDVTNTGSRNGEEVVQLYLSEISPTELMPVKALKGFRRIAIDVGHTTTVSFTLTADEFYRYNETTAAYEVPPGQWRVAVGGSSDNLVLSGEFTISAGGEKPDLLVTSVRTVPPYPLPGDTVLFLASVKNQGSAWLLSGVPAKVSFSLDGVPICYSDDYSDPIPPGGMALVCANRGYSGSNSWVADSSDHHTVLAIVDPENELDECVETNNELSRGLSVYPRPLPNLALHKAVSVSSIESPGYEETKAVDGNMATRWSSAFSDPQLLMIDLGQTSFLEDVLLYWEAAYAKEYYVRIAVGDGGWTDVAHVTNGDGGIDRIVVGANASRIMVFGVQRATQWGYSLFEVVVNGGAAVSVDDQRTQVPNACTLEQCFPNPFNPATSIGYSVGVVGLPAGQAGGQSSVVSSNVRLAVYDMLGREVAVLVDERKQPGVYAATWNAAGMASGVYIYRLTTNNSTLCRSMVLLK